MVSIDKNKLDQLVKNSGLNRSAFSTSLGHSSTFIGKCIKSGRMSLSDVQLIKKMYETDIELQEAKQEPIIEGEHLELPLNKHIDRLMILMLGRYLGMIDHFEEAKEFVRDTGCGLSKDERDTFISIATKAINFTTDLILGGEQ